MKRASLWIGLLFTVSVSAQSHHATEIAAAKSLFSRAETLKDTEPERAAGLYKQAVEADIDFLPAHEAFILAMKRWKMGPEPPQPPPAPNAPKNSKGVTIYFAPKTRAIPLGGGPAAAELQSAYTAWLEQHPSKAVLHWGLGFVQLSTDRAAADASLRRALEVDPKFSPAYRTLALIAQINHDDTGRAAMLKKAVDADPLDHDSLLEYVEVIPEAERAARLWTIVDRSPGTMTSYAALLKLSNLAATPDAKLVVYARMWKEFPSFTTYSYCWSMKTYFSLASGADPDTALAVARRFDDVCVGDPDWPDLLAYQMKYNEARTRVAQGQFAPAATLLKTLTPPRTIDAVPFYVLSAQAAGAGSADAAYKSLLGLAAKAPKDQVNQALATFGATLGKTSAQIDDDVWAATSAMAKPFKDFTLTRYDNNKPLTLSSLRGKVVLVNFWFPTCGPCMNEFPYIQQALNRYKDKGFEILAINIVSTEDKDVLPLVAQKKFTFTTLKMPDPEFASREYRVGGAPTNFLIDRDGRAVYQPQIHDRETARTFELEIERLLSRSGKK